MELLLFISAARRASANSICAVIPYYGYGRVTEVGTMHNCLTGADVAEMLQAAGVSSVISVDLYKEQLQGFFTPNITVDSIPIMHLLAAYVTETDSLDGPVVVAANAHNVYRAKAFRESLDKLQVPNTSMGMAIEVDRSHVLNVDKSENNVIDSTEREADAAALKTEYATMENTYDVVGDIAGKDAIIVDNYSLTGDTVCRVAKALKEQGAKKISVVVTHGLFNEEALKQIDKAPIARVISTNTVPASETEKVCGKWVERCIGKSQV
jgi:ribose-phosphate pyrophosphokinase